MGLFSRHAEQMAVEALADTRVVVVPSRWRTT
jgi:hypothetical protein